MNAYIPALLLTTVDSGFIVVEISETYIVYLFYQGDYYPLSCNDDTLHR
jgi:hypothetical protein